MSDIALLSCQRALFEVPEDVCYLDAAAWTPLPRPVREAAEQGMLAKVQPWAGGRDESVAEPARIAAAALIGAAADDIAIVGAVSYGMATAARNLAPAPGGRLLRVADEFPSHRLPWDRLAAERGLLVEEVDRPADGDWTAALLAAIHRPGAAPLAIATLSPLHWSDGTLMDLDRLAPAVRQAGAALVIDATQAVGAMLVDVARLQPDFMAFPTYKWVLGPFSVAFLYAAPHRQDGVPLEENSGNQAQTGARRYDKGERNDPLLLPMASAGMALVARWGAPAVAGRLRHLTDLLAEGAERLGLTMAPRELRSPHILGLGWPGGLPSGLIERLRADKVFVSDRLGTLRISPHVWADEADVARCLYSLQACLA